MLENLKPLVMLPQDFQKNWLAQLHSVSDSDEERCEGAFRLVKIRRTKPKTYEERRIVVLVVDENGFPIPSVMVAFAYSTAHPYILADDENWQWNPPAPHRADIWPTHGSGEIDEVQGGGIIEGQPGGMTVYIFDPKYPSDYVTGCGMLADHTGMHLTFQLRRKGVKSIITQLSEINDKLTGLQNQINQLKK